MTIVKAAGSVPNSLEHSRNGRTVPRTVAVTGGTGLIGRTLVPLLALAGYQVRVLTRDQSASASVWQSVRGDLLEPSSIREFLDGADIVIHLAGVAHTTLHTPAELEAARQVNVKGTRILLDAALKAKVPRFLFASSAYVYAGHRGVDLKEDAPVSTSQAYAGMKLEAELAIAEAAGLGLSTAILRPCLTYGPGVKHNLQTLMRALHRGYYVQVIGARTVRSLASVDTVAAAFLYLLQQGRLCGIYNVSDRDPVELELWVDQLALMMNRRRPIALPLTVMRTMAKAGTLAARLGVPAPLTRESLAKLTQSFSLNTDKLAAAGFSWPLTQREVLRAMVAAEFSPLTHDPKHGERIALGGDA